MRHPEHSRFEERDTSQYTVNGRRLPSVTEVLDLAGIVSFEGVPLDKLEEAASRGRFVHALIAEGLDDSEIWKRPVAEPAICGYIDAFEHFLIESGHSPVLSEQRVHSLKHQFVGTLDLLTITPRDTYALIDIKTAPYASAWEALQLAGYAIALDESELTTEKLRTSRYSLHLRKDGSYRLTPFASAADRGDFLAALRVASWQLRHGDYRLD